MAKGKGFIGVDLDKTLALYERWVSPSHIGEPIKLMVDRVKEWLGQDKNVKIFTARVAPDKTLNERVEAEEAIRAWCKKHIGEELEVTAYKSSHMYEFWDDRAVAVIPNTGKKR